MTEILTIAIPTFNRPAYLKRQLERLLSQNDGRISVLVSDNGSDDETPEITGSFMARMPNLRYSRNPRNIGFDGNLLKLYELTCTEYIWFLSDDDMILPGAVEEVIGLISRYVPTVAVLGARSVDDDSGSPVKGCQDRGIEVIERMESVDDYNLFKKTIFLSGLVVRKLPDITIDELSRLTGTNFFQVSLSMVLLSRNFRVCLAPGILVVEREPGYVTRTEIAILWFVGPAKAMHLPQYGYDPSKVRDCLSGSWRGFATLVFAAKLGMYRINPRMGSDTSRRLRELLGIRLLLLVNLCLALYRIAPTLLLKGIYWLRCVIRFGFPQGVEYFHRKTMQASSGKASGF